MFGVYCFRKEGFYLSTALLTTLTYLWIQLDQNYFNPKSLNRRTATREKIDEISFHHLRTWEANQTRPTGHTIHWVRDHQGNPLTHTIVDTMMRIELPNPLLPQHQFVFSLSWDYPILEQKVLWGRSGYENLEGKNRRIYELAQWFPRLAAYTDVTGWQNKAFLGRGEFTLEFGDYLVRITVPEHHIVASTGLLQNPNDVLTPKQQDRLKLAETARRPQWIISPEEAQNCAAPQLASRIFQILE